MDAVTIDSLLAELWARFGGRYLSRPRATGTHAIGFEVSGDRENRLWLDAARGTAGLYGLSRDETRSLAAAEERELPGRTRQALLLFRKHLDGVRLDRLLRVPGERTIRIETGGGLMVLRLSAPAPALTLVVDDRPIATIGEGSEAWPLPPDAPEREWDRIDPAAIVSAVESASGEGRTPLRAILAVCPGLGPRLARELAASPASFPSLRGQLLEPRPTLFAPAEPHAWHDRDLAASDAVSLVPFPLSAPGTVALHPPSWLDAAALFLRARRRGRLFEGRVRQAREDAGRKIRKHAQLEAHLVRDLERLSDPARLRHMAEALLAAPASVPPAADRAQVADPYEPSRRIDIPLDPKLSAAANADRLFHKARRIERARVQIEGRLAETRLALQEARRREARLAEARDVGDLDPEPAERGPRAPAPRSSPAGPPHYLTSRGLSIRVGRGARENHHLTFTVARPEDVWLHARDVPGAHVILRDDEGRAGSDDLREAAEVAAFFSEAKTEARVDVHVTRRKHLRPARGGPGRVVIAHSDTLRVAPRDPEGRLRRR
jgi:NFACT N-terminal and middle domains/NFACT protein RNA binding domain